MNRTLRKISTSETVCLSEEEALLVYHHLSRRLALITPTKGNPTGELRHEMLLLSTVISKLKTAFPAVRLAADPPPLLL